MKKLLSWIVAAMLLLSGGSAMAEETSPGRKVCSDWFDYLFVSERMYSNLNWAAEAVEQFVQEPTWENLQIAKMTVTTAIRYVTQRELPEVLMTQEEYSAMMKDGADVSFVNVHGKAFEQDRAAVLGHLAVIQESLEADIFWTYGMEIVARSAGYFKEISRIQYEYLALSTDYLMAVLSDEALAAMMDESVSAHLQPVDAYRLKEETSPEDIQEKANALLDGLEAQGEIYKGYLAAAEASLDVFSEAYDSGDWSELISRATDIGGLPVMLPDPGWTICDGWEAIYYWQDEEGHIAVPEEMEEIDRIPDGYMISCPGITKEEVIRYCNDLSGLGIQNLGSKDEDSGLTVYYTFGNSTFALEWADGTAKINMLEDPLGFAPLWYIEAIYLNEAE